jgi:hypothetical protein
LADISTTLTDWSTTAGSNSPSGATNIGTGLDDNLRAIQAAIRSEYDKTVPALIPGGRITLATGTPVTTTDQTGKTTVYYTPYLHDKINLFDGVNWKQYTFTERSLAVPATTATVYDLFMYDNSGTLTLEATAWTNDTTRATALTTQNGVLVKTAATTRRYLGSFRTTGVSGETEDSLAKRYVWNYYNRTERLLKVIEGTNSWTYSTASWRQANNAAANQLDMVIGVSEDPVEAHVVAFTQNSAGVNAAIVGVGVDKTNGNDAQFFGYASSNSIVLPTRAEYKGYPGVGRHYLAWVENAVGGGGTQTWYGDDGGSAVQSGISGSVRG